MKMHVIPKDGESAMDAYNRAVDELDTIDAKLKALDQRVGKAQAETREAIKADGNNVTLLTAHKIVRSSELVLELNRLSQEYIDLLRLRFPDEDHREIDGYEEQFVTSHEQIESMLDTLHSE